MDTGAGNSRYCSPHANPHNVFLHREGYVDCLSTVQGDARRWQVREGGDGGGVGGAPPLLAGRGGQHPGLPGYTPHRPVHRTGSEVGWPCVGPDLVSPQLEGRSPHGWGEMVWRAGTRYGDQGQFYYSAGDRYLGEWVEGRQVGREVQCTSVQYNCAVQEGVGTLYSQTGVYVGDWVAGLQQGNGTAMYNNGNRCDRCFLYDHEMF